jgi:hypothetical protein
LNLKTHQYWAYLIPETGSEAFIPIFNQSLIVDQTLILKATLSKLVFGITPFDINII